QGGDSAEAVCFSFQCDFSSRPRASGNIFAQIEGAQPSKRDGTETFINAITRSLMDIIRSFSGWTPPKRDANLCRSHPPEAFMKAVVISEHGGPEVLRYTDFPETTIGAQEVLVRVRACALNHLDLWIR